RRNTIWLEHSGTTHTLVQWSETLNIPYTTLYTRYKIGKPPEEILAASCLSGCFSKPQDVAVSHNTCCQPSRRACGFRSTRGLSPPARHRLKPALFWAKLITGPLARAKLRSCICCLAANTICWGLLKQPDKQKPPSAALAGRLPNGLAEPPKHISWRRLICLQLSK